MSDGFRLTGKKLIYGASSAAGGRNVTRRLELLAGLQPFAGGTAADIGGGRGSYSAELIGWYDHLTLVDIDPQAVAAARQRLEATGRVTCLTAAAEATGLPDGGFDAVFMIEVLDHADDPAAAVREARRLLKPGGWLYLTVPNRAFPFETHPVRFGRHFVSPRWVPFLPWVPMLHRRLATARVFTPRLIRQMAQQAGFLPPLVEWLMPPMERAPRLQGLSDRLQRGFLRRFGVSLCAVMQRPAN